MFLAGRDDFTVRARAVVRSCVTAALEWGRDHSRTYNQITNAMIRSVAIAAKARHEWRGGRGGFEDVTELIIRFSRLNSHASWR